MSRPTGTTYRGANTANLPAPGVPFYTPAQTPVAGSPVDAAAADVPTVFTPLRIRGVELANRIVVSPMCTYSADEGHMTDFHVVHVGQFALHGAGLTIVEATSVTPNGRISPEDAGLWQDSQIAPLKRVADAVHSQGHKIGIQLAHAGRKASSVAPWLVPTGADGGGRQYSTAAEGGWPDRTWSASARPYAADWPVPLAMTKADIAVLTDSFAAAAKRAVAAGIDVIELHGAHGYLMTQFLSPQTNKRTDEYGGSFENRTRLLAEVVTAIRAVIPATMPLFLRLSATEWLETVTAEPSWTVADTVRLAARLPALGVDLLDVSSGGNAPQQKLAIHPYYQIDLATAVKAGLRAAGPDGAAAAAQLLIGVVGLVTTADMARDVAQTGGKVEADLVLVGRQFLREPEFVQRAAHQLGLPLNWPKQYQRARWRRDTKI